MKESIIRLLFSPHLNMGAGQMLEHDRIARLIESAGDVVTLEEEDYQAVRMAVDTFHGYSRQDVEFVNRILQAPEV